MARHELEGHGEIRRLDHKNCDSWNACHYSARAELALIRSALAMHGEPITCQSMDDCMRPLSA